MRRMTPGYSLRVDVANFVITALDDALGDIVEPMVGRMAAV